MEEGKPKKERRQRRRFSDEYKASTVKLVLSGRKTAGQVARDLDLTETAVRHWVKQAQVDAARVRAARSRRPRRRSSRSCARRSASSRWRGRS